MAQTRDFSKRHGFQKRPPEVVREGAPEALRAFVLRKLSYRAHNIHGARRLASEALKYIPNPTNQRVKQIWNEIEQAIQDCDWFLIYDLIEEMYRDLAWSFSDQDVFMRDVNELFEDQNLGWILRTAAIEGTHLVAPEIVFRGSHAFELTFTRAVDVLHSSGRITAHNELDEAIQDLSRRPHPDLTGAVQHAIAALECVAADVCGDRSETLGQIVKHHPDRFPDPLGDAVSKLYGFASDRGRHIAEGKAPSQEEVEFVVSVAAAVTTFLLR
jgi:AbiJ N-terminal domain 4